MNVNKYISPYFKYFASKHVMILLYMQQISKNALMMMIMLV